MEHSKALAILDECFHLETRDWSSLNPDGYKICSGRHLYTFWLVLGRRYGLPTQSETRVRTAGLLTEVLRCSHRITACEVLPIVTL